MVFGRIFILLSFFLIVECAKAQHNAMIDSLESESLETGENLSKKGLKAANYKSVGKILIEQDEITSGIRYLNKAIKIANSIEHKELIQECYYELSIAYEKINSYDKAAEYLKLYNVLKDSLFNERNTQMLAEITKKYATSKKQKHIEILKKERDIQSIEIKKKKITIYAVGGGIVFIILFSVLIYRQYKTKKKVNTLLADQNTKIEIANKEMALQKEIIEEKNKEIQTSINYANQIEKVLLAKESIVKKHLPSSFVLFKPKDVVSGDFYSLYSLEEKIIFSVGDCTGHGVPGALMSILVNNLLNGIIKKNRITQPALILDALNIELRKTLNRKVDGSLINDGVDLTVCSIDFRNNQLEYAGAYNPLYLIRQNVLIEYKGNMIPVGNTLFHSNEDKFTNHVIEIAKGDIIYLFSDGFADQKGEQTRKKYYYKRFKDFLLAIHLYEMEEQKQKLTDELQAWKGRLEQVDDVLVMGVKI